MKKIATLAAGLLAFGSLTAAAQTDAPEVLQKVSLFYNLNTLFPKDADNSYFNGGGVAYNVDFLVSDAMPLYVGTGIDARIQAQKKDIIETEAYSPVKADLKTTFVNLNVPVNVSYRVPVAESFYLSPVAGLDFRVQAYGKSKLSGSMAGVLDTSTTTDLFSKSDLGNEHLRRFQLAWHAGLNFEYNRFNLGLTYGTDFVKLHKNLGASNFIASLGYVF